MSFIEKFDLKETKKKVNHYFMELERLEWEQARLSAGKGLTAKYDVAYENNRQGYVATGKDAFSLSAKEGKKKEIEKHLAGYQWAKSILSEQELQYITECFVNGKYEDEVVGLLGFNGSDSRAFRDLKRKAIYKFAYVLNLVMRITG